MIPDAGSSTGVVADLLVSLADSMSHVALSVANSADAVQAALGGYTDTERHTTAPITGSDPGGLR